METKHQQLEALHDIRQMMKDSSKFLSLSGLSGIFAGVYALAGVAAVLRLILGYAADQNIPREELVMQIALVSAAVLLSSILTALFLSMRKAKRLHQSLFDHTSKKVFLAMAIPLSAGCIFCVSLLLNGVPALICAAMLIFYGLALISAGKYTQPEIRVLGALQVLLGIVASLIPQHGLVFWTLGFGFLHIIYGAIMWNKYERHA
jgi:hypothetical protein